MMEEILRKLLMLANPLGIAWLLLALWLLAALLRRRRGILLPALAWLTLTAATCTPLPSWLLMRLENETPQVKVETLPVADAILCLGGGAEPSLTEPTGFHLKEGADRVTTALLLSQLKKAATLVVGGGGYPQGGERLSEADALAARLRQQSALPVVSLGLCWDTHDEAQRFAELAKSKAWGSVLLVTSASHMPRAQAVFKKLGIDATAVPCDYESSFNRVGEVDWIHLPNDHNLRVFSRWIHEVIGQAVYRWRGWI
jgi:uncharacterized SAM-binding protein YcdF (DUF218 family)